MMFDATYIKQDDNYLNLGKDTDIKMEPNVKNHRNNQKKSSSVNSDSIKLYDLVAIKFPSEGKILSGFVTIEYIYNSKKLTITYSNIKYSDKRMEDYLEQNPNVIKNIDSYLKNKMIESEFKVS
jgi:hypothetical protein